MQALRLDPAFAIRQERRQHSPTLTPSASGPAFGPGVASACGPGVPLAKSRCHALTASFSFSRPLAFKLTFFPSSVVYHVPLLSLNHG